MKEPKNDVELAYKELLNNSIAPIIIYRGDKIIFANKACYKMVGYDADDNELNSVNFWDFAIDKEKIKDIGIRRQKGENVPSKYEVLLAHKDGREIYIEYSGKEIEWNGAPAVMGSFYDLSQQKEAEYKLIESEKRYKALANITNEAIFFSQNGIGIDCNKTAEIMFGYTRDEVIGMMGTTIVPDDYKTLIVEKMLSDYSEPYEAIGLKKDQTEFPIEIQGSQIIYSGKTTRVTIVRDISKQKQAEQNLKSSEEKYRTLTETLTDCVFMTDENGIFTYLSPAFENITAYKTEEFIGRHFLGGVALNSQDKISKIFSEAKTTPSSLLYEIEIVSKNHKNIPVEISANSLIDESGVFQGRIGTFRNITQRQESELALVEAKEKAEESDKLKTSFLQNMSHEIRTPLNGILGFADLLQEPRITEEYVQKYSQIISNSGQRLLSLINNILDISKIESENIELELKPFILNQLLRDIYHLLTLKAKEKGIVLEVDYFLTDQESMIISDNGKLNQILINLINNAIKFTEKGQISCSYKIEGNNLLFSIKDTGIGISKDQQKQIFNRFYRTDFTKNRNYEGAGLGLSITKGLVELLGGKIEVKSEMGKGSEFYFTIPYVTDIPKKVKDKPTIIELPRKGLRILIAEDDDTSFLFIEALLSKYDINLFRTNNGKDTIDFCNNTSIDMVLMDINMPQIDGIECTRIIKKRKPNLPIIVQSAYAFSLERDEAIEAGCNGFISKPIVKEELLKLILSIDKK